MDYATFFYDLVFDDMVESMIAKPISIDVDRVIFNPPATIVFWKDGTKTVVKACDEDSYSPEGGFALCFLKKVLGGKDNFHRYLKDSCGEALKEFEDKQKPIVF